jgi:hypothetical protein
MALHSAQIGKTGVVGRRWPVSGSQAESCFSKTFMSSNTWLAGILTRDTTARGS